MASEASWKRTAKEEASSGALSWTVTEKPRGTARAIGMEIDMATGTVIGKAMTWATWKAWAMLAAKPSWSHLET